MPIVTEGRLQNNLDGITGYSAAVAHLFWEQKVGSSILSTPTKQEVKMKVGDRVKDISWLDVTPQWRGKGTIISLTPCGDKNCNCPGFVQVHWDNKEEPDQEGQDYVEDVEVIEE